MKVEVEPPEDYDEFERMSEEELERMEQEGLLTDDTDDSNWALLWSDIFTFSRALEIAKKSRSTHLKQHF